MKRSSILILVVLAVALAMAGPAHATTCSTSSTAGTCSIDLTITNGFGPNGQVYGTVTLTLNGNGTISVDVQAASGFGFHNQPFGLNLANGASVSGVSGVSYTFAGSDPGAPSFTPQPPGNMDGFGTFQWGVISGGSGSSSDYTDMKFTISGSDNNGAGFSALSDVITGNNRGSSNIFAVQIAYIANGTTGCTGFAGNAGSANNSTGVTPCVPLTQTPEPGSLGLVGSGVLALGTVLRRKFAA